MRYTVKIVMNDGVPMQEVNETLRLSLIAVESLHGAELVGMVRPAKFDLAKRSIFISMEDKVGRDTAAIFGGFIRREFGEESFKVFHLT